MSWAVEVDRDRCIGSGLCVVYAGGTFDQDSDAKCVIRDPATSAIEEVATAVEACPTHALTLTTDGREEKA